MFFLTNAHYTKLSRLVCCSTPVSACVVQKNSSANFFLYNLNLKVKKTSVHVECLLKYSSNGKLGNSFDSFVFVAKNPCLYCASILIKNTKTDVVHLFFFVQNIITNNYYNFLFKYRHSMCSKLKLFFLCKRVYD